MEISNISNFILWAFLILWRAGLDFNTTFVLKIIMDSSSKSSKVILFLVIFGGIISVLFFVVAIFLVFFVFSGNNNELGGETYDYQYQRINTLNNETRRPQKGFVTLSKKLMNDDYISYYDNESKRVMIISNVGGDEYECTGSCFCVNEKDRSERRYAASGKILGQGLFMLFSAFSVSMAIKMAEDAFRNTCEEEYDDSCEEIDAEIEDCVVAEEEDDIGADEIVADDIEYEDLRKYICSGRCQDNSNLLEVIKERGLKYERLFFMDRPYDEEMEKEKEEAFKEELVCKDLRMERNFQVSCNAIIEEKYKGGCDGFAVKLFKDKFRVFCEENSYFDVEIMKRGEIVGTDLKNLCILGRGNEDVKCVRTE